MTRPAVFLDRDGTIIRDTGYVSRPEAVALIPGAAAAIRRLNDEGVPVVLVTNQSGIARGLFTGADYERVHERVLELLRAGGASVRATYMCPHHPAFTGECDCRKPGTLLFRQAATDLDLDLAGSFYVGDKLRDITPGGALGGIGILVPTADTAPRDLEAAAEAYRVSFSLDEAVDRIIESLK